MKVRALDHIVLAVADVARTCAFYERVLGMTPVEHQPGKWALAFGPNKISLQPADDVPPIARRTTPGSGNFCVLSDVPMNAIVEHLAACGIEIVAGPDARAGATGPILSVYFYDPDGNLVEVSNAT